MEQRFLCWSLTASIRETSLSSVLSGKTTGEKHLATACSSAAPETPLENPGGYSEPRRAVLKHCWRFLRCLQGASLGSRNLLHKFFLIPLEYFGVPYVAPLENVSVPLNFPCLCRSSTHHPPSLNVAYASLPRPGHPTSKKLLQYLSRRIFAARAWIIKCRRKEKLIAQFGGKLRDERFSLISPCLNTICQIKTKVLQ